LLVKNLKHIVLTTLLIEVL